MRDALARITASATPLLLESSSDLREFAVQRWLFTASFVDDVRSARINLARIAGAMSALKLNGLSDEARCLHKAIQSDDESSAQICVGAAQSFFSLLLHDHETVRLLATSSAAQTWFGDGFLAEAAREAERQLYVDAASDR